MMNGGRPILDCIMHKLPSTRKYYRVSLIVPDNGIPSIQYSRASGSKKPFKSIQFVDLLFADKKHDTNEKFAFSVYTICKTTTFLAQDEATMNEWLTKIREYHSALYPEFKRYDAIFEANIIDKGLARTMNIKGNYRLALCKESLDLMPLLTATAINEQQQSIFKAPNINSTATTTTTTSSSPTPTSPSPTTTPKTTSHETTSLTASVTTKLSTNFHNLHDHIMNQHQPHHLANINNPINPNTSITPHSNYHPHMPQHLPSHQRFYKRHPLLMSKTIELVLRSIRRCGHTDSNFYIESGRHSQIGEGDLWMTLNKKATARQLHELLLATMKLASTVEDQYIYKGPRSRSGSSSDNAHRSQQSRSSSIVCLNSTEFSSNGINNTTSSSSSSSVTTSAPATITVAAPLAPPPPPQQQLPATTKTSNPANNMAAPNINNNNLLNQLVQSAASATAAAASSAMNSMNTINMFTSNKNMEEDTGYLPMA